MPVCMCIQADRWILLFRTGVVQYHTFLRRKIVSNTAGLAKCKVHGMCRIVHLIPDKNGGIV